MRKIGIISLVLIGVICTSMIWIPTSNMLKEYRRRGLEPLLGPYVSLHEPGVTTWTINKNEWWFQGGEADLELHLETPRTYSEGNLSKEDLNVKVKIKAFAITPDGNKYDRLIRNWWFTSDEPLSSINNFSDRGSWFGLGCITRYPNESTVIEVIVIKANPSLKFVKPRLSLKADYDQASIPYVMLFYGIGYIVYAGVILSILLLAYLAWRSPRKEK